MAGRRTAIFRSHRTVAAIAIALLVAQAGSAALLVRSVRADSAVDHFAWDPSPIAPTGSLTAQQDRSFAVTPYDIDGRPVLSAEIYVTYSGMFTSRTVPVFTGLCDGETNNSVTLSSTPVRCVPDSSTGALRFNFYSGAALPNGGTETFTAAADTAGTLASSDSYTFATSDHFVWTDNPIAPAGSLKAQTDRSFRVKAYDSADQQIIGGPIYMTYSGRFTSINPPIFSGHCDGEVSGNIVLSATPVRCVTDPSTGILSFNFYSGATLPNGGTETYTAASDGAGTNAASDSYTFAASDHFVWTDNPIAPAGSLAKETDRSFRVKAYDSADQQIIGGEIYMTYSGRLSSINAPVFTGHCDGQVSGNVVLSATPVRCVTDPSTGILSFNFYSGSVLPNGGTETYTAASDAAGSNATSDSYTFAAIDHFVWTDDPIAPDGSLSKETDRSFAVKAYDSAGTVIRGGAIWMTYSGRFGSINAPVFDGFCDGQVSGSVVLSATPVRCVTERQDGNLSFNFYTGAVLPNGGTETYTAAADANGLRAASDHYTFATVTTLTYDGATTGDYNDPATLSATLIRNAGSVPIVGETVTFDLDGVETCSGTTNASGRASCQVTPGEAAGSYTVHASFAGAGPDLAVSTSSPFTVTLEDTQLTLAPTSFLANGLSFTLSATLTDPADPAEGEAASPIAGKSVAFTLGSGTTAQTCSATTNATGVASCTIAHVNQPLGNVAIAASFAGDAYYRSASANGTAIAFAYLARGSFVVGDRSATVNSTVTWWSPSWSTANRLSGGAAPSAFKGFASTLSSSPPVAGGTWTTSGGSSAGPPSSVPTYMAIIVTNRVSKSGSTIFSGTDTRIAIVQVAPGYNPTTGTPGTGKLLGFLP